MQQTLVRSMEIPPQVTFRLLPDQRQAEDLYRTLHTFQSACLWIDANTPPKIKRATIIRAWLYERIQRDFGLPSTLAYTAILCVAKCRQSMAEISPMIKFSETGCRGDAEGLLYLTLLHGRTAIEVDLKNAVDLVMWPGPRVRGCSVSNIADGQAWQAKVIVA